ncbi:MAG: LemA family protein [Clostridia bacterium]|nr:LemA family protein [Clostridia bacterium]
MKKGTIIIIAIVAVIAIIGAMCVSNYNTLVTARESVDSAEANVDTYLQRRADLIPNVVASVKSFAKHETEVFDKVLAAREKLVGADTVADKAQANQELTSALQGLTLVVENYPELKSDTTYVALMDELEGSENRIATARKDYNDTVQAYNNKIIKFPANVFAGIFGFEKAEYFEADEGAQDAPSVDELLGD